MMSSRTRSGGALPALRSAASPSSATLSLYSSLSALTRMSTLVLTSSTMRTRLSERFFTSGSRNVLRERVLQLRLRPVEIVVAHALFELPPDRGVEERPQRGLVGVEKVRRAGLEPREKRGPAGGRRTRLDRVDGSGRRCGLSTIRSNRSERRFHLAEQGREASGNLLDGRLDRAAVAAVANQLLERAGSVLDRAGADVA